MSHFASTPDERSAARVSLPGHLDLDLLRCFVAVMELDSFSLAAKALGRTQSAVSMKIKRLETAAGHVLLHREARGLRLTAAGRLVWRHAKDVLRQNDALFAMLLHEGGATPRLRVGLDALLLGARAGLIAREARETLGAATVELVDGPADDLLRQLDRGVLHLVLCGAAGPCSGLPMHTVRWSWARADSPSLDAQEPLPVVAPPQGHALWPAMRLALDASARRWSLRLATHDAGTYRSAIEAGAGIGLLPEDGLGPALRRLPQSAGLTVPPATRIEAFHLAASAWKADEMGGFLLALRAQFAKPPHQPACATASCP